MSYSDEHVDAILAWVSKQRPAKYRVGTARIVEHAITLLLSAATLLLEHVPLVADQQRPRLVKRILRHYRSIHTVIAELVEAHRKLRDIEPHEGSPREAAACLASLHMARRYIIKDYLPGYIRFLQHMK